MVLAHEDPGVYSEHLQAWIDALLPADEAELEVAVSVADLRWRLKRIDAVEMNRQRAEVLAQVDETTEQAFLNMVENAATATKAMADTLALALPQGAPIQCLFPAIRQVIDMVEAVEREQVLRLGSAELADAASLAAILSANGEPDPASVDDLRKAAQACTVAVAGTLSKARAAVDHIRERLSATVPLPDGKQQALLTRYRKDIERRLASEMAFLTAVRERRVQAKASSGSLGEPIPVSIRLVG